MKTVNKKLIITLLLIVAAISLAVSCYFLLPDMVVMQISTSGSAGTTLPKPIAVLIPLVISVAFAIAYYKNENGSKSMIISIVGLALFVVTLLFNL